ncbi:coiled-coil domain-containing protein [Adhaeretor mobilis]|uniref:Uncharacterized protein n=1 Tax=Adhaeretor mobilis TaxID=1930276 RepID=A0A517N0X5_9BACT|nr:hypothetical protein [Adhaeretor mobilis]QDT00668.1 hypothetical protein HG15A2_40070 [Adhaeretor mobilis]
MTTTALAGSRVGNELDRSIGRLRKQIDQHLAGMKQIDEQLAELVGRRTAALADLARHYLPDISPESIQGTFAEIRHDLLEVLQRKRQREAELSSTIGQLERSIDSDEEELDRVTEALNEKVAERERLEELLAERLHASDEFRELSKRALDAEVELERNEVRVAEAKQESSEKLPAYEKSRLFKYLQERDYGTAAYKKEGLTRVLDGWVAKMIGFRRARRSYDFLRVTPELMAKEVQRRREHFNVLMEQVEAIEDRNSDEIGLTAVMREGQELGAKRDALTDAIAKQQDRLIAHEEELLQLQQPNNKYHDQAIARMKFFLSKMEESKLQRRSRQTPEPQDDAIVAEVLWLNERLDDAERQGQAESRKRQQWDDKLSGLHQIQQRFREAEFDSRRSMFHPRFEMADLVEDYLEGDLGTEGLWSAIRKNQEFAPQWHEQRGGGFDDFLNSEMSYVLFRVLTDVAGHALRNAARRGMERRGPIRTQQRRQSGRPKLPRRGFTKGRGF